MEAEFRQNIRQRHDELKKLGKVTEAVELSGFSHMTYSRAVNGTADVRAGTLMAILKAQAKVLDITKQKLQLA